MVFRAVFQLNPLKLKLGVTDGRLIQGLNDSHCRSRFHLLEQTGSDLWLRHHAQETPALALQQGRSLSPAPQTSPTQLAS